MNSLILILIGVITILVVISFFLLGNHFIQNDDDPLIGRVDEFSQRGQNATLEEIELLQPFTDRVVLPILKKLGINTNKLGAEEQPGKSSSLLKRIEKGQSGDDSSLQVRRVGVPSQSGSYFDLKVHVQNKLLAKINPSMDMSKKDERNHAIQSLFEQILVDENIVISRSERERLLEQIVAEIFDSQSFNISVSCPKLLSKRLESIFLIHIFLPKESIRVRSNVMLEFQNQEVNQHVTASELNRGDKIKVKLFHPDFLFSDTVTKAMEHSLNKIVVLGKPKDNCEPGLHKILVAILDAETEQELESFTFSANVVDFAFGKVSRPLLSRASAVVLGIGSFIMFVLALLEQIDKTVGLTSGTAAGVLTLAISTSFYNSYQRVRPNTP